MKLTIPIIIPTFNNPTYLQHMLNQLQTLELTNVIVIDSASTTSEMTTLLDEIEKKIRTVRLSHNQGPRYYFQNKDFYRQLPKHFCVTDPDLTFNALMPRTFLEELTEITEQFKAGKVGLALDISDADAMRTDRIKFNGKEYHIWEWEAQFWLNKIGETLQHDPIYKASVATTFALYNKQFFNPDRGDDAVRVAGRFTCKHLPWYPENGLPTAEEIAYRTSQRNSWYFGGPRGLSVTQTLSERWARNRQLIKRHGVPLWFGEKLTRWMGMSESWKKLDAKMKMDENC